MRLTHLTLAKFRSAIGLELPLQSPRVLIAGVNGVGKTNVREAIRWALTGHCDYTDAKGAGAEVLIPEGERAVEVNLSIDGIGALARTYSEHGVGSLAIHGWTGTGSIQQQALYGRLQTIPQYVDAVLNTETFLRLGHAEAKALILGLLQVRISVGEKSYTLDELEQQYKVAFTDRTVAKKALASFFMAPAPGPPTTPAIEAIEAQLKKLRTDLAAKQIANGEAIGRRKEIEKEIQRIGPGPFMGPVTEDPSATITEVELAIAAMEEAAVPVQAAPNETKTIPVLRRQSEALERHLPQNGCVLDATVPCLTQRAEFERAQDAIITLVAQRIADMEVDPAESPLTTARRHVASLRELKAARERTIAQREQFTSLTNDLKAIPDTSQQEADLAAVQARINKGMALLAEAQQYAQKVKEHDASLARKQVLESDVASLEALVEALGPKGARVKALAEAMGRFQDAVNPYVKPFGWRISFSVDPWEVYANKRPVGTYSRSEQYRIGIALQLGIAMLSGLKFAVIDETDMLDVENRKLTTGMILGSGLDQVIVIGTREVGQALPHVGGVTAFRLGKKDGLTHVVETMVESGRGGDGVKRGNGPFLFMVGLVIILMGLTVWQQRQIRQMLRTTENARKFGVASSASADHWHRMYNEAIVLCAGIR